MATNRIGTDKLLTPRTILTHLVRASNIDGI